MLSLVIEGYEVFLESDSLRLVGENPPKLVFVSQSKSDVLSRNLHTTSGNVFPLGLSKSDWWTTLEVEDSPCDRGEMDK